MGGEGNRAQKWCLEHIGGVQALKGLKNARFVLRRPLPKRDPLGLTWNTTYKVSWDRTSEGEDLRL